MLNVITLQGRLVADPELRQTPQGTNVCSFSIAVDRNNVRAGEERKADFINITAWRGTAEFVAKFFRKGSPIILDGRLQVDSYVDRDTGKNRNSYTVVANNVNFSYGDNRARQEGQSSYSVAPRETSYAQPSYTSGSQEDFAIIDDDGEDLPF